ncbi:MAG: FmdB family zinc ribbon protein [Chthoniobacterales bacterium]
MPIYEYEPICGACSVCNGRFELKRPMDREALTHCPLCKKPVRKVVSQTSSPRLSKPLSVSDAKKAGFQILERRDRGVYEKL